MTQREPAAAEVRETGGGGPAKPTFPSPVYREAVLAPIFADAKRWFLEPLLEIERAHIVMLARQGILRREEAAASLAAVQALDLQAIRTAAYDGSFEDLFFFVEQEIAAASGDEAAGRTHTARSRNDLDLTMYRMVLRDRVLALLHASLALRDRLLHLAAAHTTTLMPAYTHNQPAQPTTLAHYLMGFVEVLARDTERMREAFRRVNRSPLGACAITTTGFPIDRELTASLLGFEGLQVNSYGAIAAVDYLAEACAVVATAMLSQGRFVQDLLLWSTAEFGYLRLSDAYVQISSIMPQKRNPVALEHVRILASRALFGAQGVPGALHNTPFADMNDGEDPIQPVAYNAFTDAQRSVELLAGLLGEAEFRTGRMAAAAEANFITVTELADTLVRRAGLSFHAAHAIVSAAVRKVGERCAAGDLDAMAYEVLAAVQALPGDGPRSVTREELQEALRASHFVAVRRIRGGPAQDTLAPEIARERQQLDADRTWLGGVRQHLAGAHARLEAEVSRLIEVVSGASHPMSQAQGTTSASRG